MTIFDLFSKRQRRLRGEVPDVYQYDDIPNALRVQIVHIFRDALGDHDEYNQSAYALLKMVHDALCREYGVFHIGRENEYANSDISRDVYRFVITEGEVERVLDAVELLAKVVDGPCRDNGFQWRSRPRINPDDAINELNRRFREHGVGFQFESGEIIRVDSHLLHSEAVKPTLRFLAEPGFEGANQEYLSAHEHYRHRRYPEALTDGLKALESTMKAICDKRKWSYDKSATAKQLIAVVLDKELVPPFLQTHFASLRSGLESGVPTIRNKLGGHGQGAAPRVVPEHIVSYHLHLTASTILLLVECDKALP